MKSLRVWGWPWAALALLAWPAAPRPQQAADAGVMPAALRQ